MLHQVQETNHFVVVVAPCVSLSQVVQRLLKAGTPNKTRDNFGNTLFHGAAHGGNPLVVQALLDAGCDVSSRNGEGFTPLMVASQKVHGRLVVVVGGGGGGV